MASELHWMTAQPGVLLALVPGKRDPQSRYRRKADQAGLLYRFAIIRAARDAGGLHNPSTGSWIASLVGKLPPGVSAFDMITEHETLDAAKLHVEALYALEGSGT